MKTFTNYIENSDSEEIKVWMMIGIQGSGKSTWISKNKSEFGDFVHVHPDQYRIDLQDKMRKQDPEWTFKHEDQESQNKIFGKAHSEIRKAVEQGKNIVLDMTNLKARDRKRSIKNIKDFADLKNKKVTFTAVYFEPDPEESIRRIKVSRKEGDINFVPEDVVRSRSKIIQPPSEEEEFDQILRIK